MIRVKITLQLTFYSHVKVNYGKKDYLLYR